MSPDQRAVLRAHAETATPGPWDAGKYGIAGGEDFTTPVVSWDYAWADCANEEWDKPFIAAANPTAVLSLLDDVEQIERQTQRRMIAALYWRAGEREIDLLSSIAAGCSSHFEARLRGVAENAYATARRVEVTCAH